MGWSQAIGKLTRPGVPEGQLRNTAKTATADFWDNVTKLAWSSGCDLRPAP